MKITREEMRKLVQETIEEILAEDDLTGDQDELDVAEPKGKLTKADFDALRKDENAGTTALRSIYEQDGPVPATDYVDPENMAFQQGHSAGQQAVQNAIMQAFAVKDQEPHEPPEDIQEQDADEPSLRQRLRQRFAPAWEEPQRRRAQLMDPEPFTGVEKEVGMSMPGGYSDLPPEEQASFAKALPLPAEAPEAPARSRAFAAAPVAPAIPEIPEVEEAPEIAQEPETQRAPGYYTVGDAESWEQGRPTAPFATESDEEYWAAQARLAGGGTAGLQEEDVPYAALDEDKKFSYIAGNDMDGLLSNWDKFRLIESKDK